MTGHPVPTYSKNHQPFMRVGQAGSRCVTCRFLDPNDNTKCTEENYIAWNNGDPHLLQPAEVSCSDWWQPKSRIAQAVKR